MKRLFLLCALVGALLSSTAAAHAETRWVAHYRTPHTACGPAVIDGHALTYCRLVIRTHWVRVHHRVIRHAAPQPSTHPVASGRCFTETDLVTFYDDWGLTASGAYVSMAEAAGGYDLPLGARVFVPGVGWRVILDRIGYVPWRHLDIWYPSFGAGVAAGLGSDYRTVTVCL